MGRGPKNGNKFSAYSDNTNQNIIVQRSGSIIQIPKRPPDLIKSRISAFRSRNSAQKLAKTKTNLQSILQEPPKKQEEAEQLKLDFQIPQIEADGTENENEEKGIQFWFKRGKQISEKQEIEPAMDAYIQGLMVDDNHWQTYHNLGCCASLLDKNQTALRYFQTAHKICPNELYPIYALTITKIRLGDLNISMKYIRKANKILNHHKNKCVETSKIAFQESTTTLNDEQQANLIYFEALCRKINGDLQQANELYNKLSQKLSMKEKALVVKYTIGLLLIPTLEERSDVTHFVENLKDILELYTVKDEQPDVTNFMSLIPKINKPPSEIVDKKKTNKENSIEMKYMTINFETSECRHLLPEILKDQPSSILNLMKLKIFNNDVIFTENNLVYIIIYGDVIIKEFEHSTFPNKIMALLKRGDVIGSKYEAQSIKFDSWAIARATTLAAIFDQETFSKIWYNHQTKKRLVLQPHLKCNELLKNCCELTIFHFYNWMEIKTYKKGSLVLPQSKKSTFNNHYKIFYDEFKKKRLGTRKWDTELSQFHTQISSFFIAMAEPTKIADIVPKDLPQPINSDSELEDFDAEPCGIYIILSGTCELIAKSKCYQEKPNSKNLTDEKASTNNSRPSPCSKMVSLKTLVKGDFFGESEIFRIPDLTYYGHIFVSKEQDCEIMFLNYRAFRRIPLWELEEIKNRFENKKGEYQNRNNVIEYCLKLMTKK
ncbi:unnamed protein product [Moneuplotes crassus]|uniref:Cyclic nucleotide-binding domain-containing protein n=1 Tax=Euplotes crassus TaxID=5936 RepID=A0AAD2DCQ5_EUPCR|nr:unnamed protein product [Moneuplotes crassus]